MYIIFGLVALKVLSDLIKRGCVEGEKNKRTN